MTRTTHHVDIIACLRLGRWLSHRRVRCQSTPVFTMSNYIHFVQALCSFQVATVMLLVGSILRYTAEIWYDNQLISHDSGFSIRLSLNRMLQSDYTERME
jgi:hypothetical protein